MMAFTSCVSGLVGDVFFACFWVWFLISFFQVRKSSVYIESDVKTFLEVLSGKIFLEKSLHEEKNNGVQ